MELHDIDHTLRQAATVVAGEGLSDAFGHLSIRTAPDEIAITPPVALGHLRATHRATLVPLEAESLPDSAPREAWIHQVLAQRRPDVGAVCRAQPPSVAALAATGQPLLPLHGHGSFLGETVPVHGDSRLIRDRTTAETLADAMDDSPALVMRGNGAVTVGPDIAHAVALMWVLERSAELNLRARAAGGAQALPGDEQDWWRDRADELLPRIYAYLVAEHPLAG